MTKIELKIEAFVNDDNEVDSAIGIGDFEGSMKMQEGVEMIPQILFSVLVRYISGFESKAKQIELSDLMRARLQRLTQVLHEEGEHSRTEYKRKLKRLEKIGEWSS